MLKFKLEKNPENLKNPYLVRITFLQKDDNIKNKIEFDEKWDHIKDLIIKSKVTVDAKTYKLVIDQRKKNITEDLYNELAKFTNKGMITLFRYELPIRSDLIIHIDNYIGGLYGMITARIKFDETKISKEKILELIKDHLGENLIDITGDNKYNNSSLSKLNNIVLSKKSIS